MYLYVKETGSFLSIYVRNNRQLCLIYCIMYNVSDDEKKEKKTECVRIKDHEWKRHEDEEEEEGDEGKK